VIGGGIVGNSLLGWLAELGWTDLVQLDKGPFPNPGGSTGHASNFIFPVDHSKEMTQLTLDSMKQYSEAGTLHECGGIEVARTEERLEELRRRMASAKSWGVEGCRLVTPAEIKELVPFVEESILLGGFYSPTVAVVDHAISVRWRRDKQVVPLPGSHIVVFMDTPIEVQPVNTPPPSVEELRVHLANALQRLAEEAASVAKSQGLSGL